MPRSNSWKDLEKQIRDTLIKFNLPATRLTRGADWSESTFDVVIDAHPQYKFDGKYSQRGHRANTMLDLIEAKYCKAPGDVPVLCTKGYKERGFKVTVPGEHYIELLSFYLTHKDKV